MQDSPPWIWWQKVSLSALKRYGLSAGKQTAARHFPATSLVGGDIRCHPSPKSEQKLRESTTMTEEACRTRSQKRALERESNQNDVDSKKMKLDKGLLGDPEASAEGGDLKLKTDPTAGRVPGLLKGGEMKATIKVEVQTGDEPVDMSTSKR
ncbi:UNVERIFIED_CONTAM: hypothetical protein K2H54_014676 [Gekko kuhli]